MLIEQAAMDFHRESGENGEGMRFCHKRTQKDIDGEGGRITRVKTGLPKRLNGYALKDRMILGTI